MGAVIRRGDRLLLRTDVNKTYMVDDWEKRSPYLRSDGTRWCIEKGVVLVGYDFYHGVDEPGAPRVFNASRTLSEAGIVTLPYLNNLDRIAAGASRWWRCRSSSSAQASPVRGLCWPAAAAALGSERGGRFLPSSRGQGNETFAHRRGRGRGNALVRHSRSPKVATVRLSVLLRDDRDPVASWHDHRRAGPPLCRQARQTLRGAGHRVQSSGAGGLIAAQAVAAAPPRRLYRSLGEFRPRHPGTLEQEPPSRSVQDFAGVSLIGETAALVTVPPSLGSRSLQAFVDLAKAKPGTVNYAPPASAPRPISPGLFRQAGRYSNGARPLQDRLRAHRHLLEGRVQVTSRPPSRCRCCRRANCWRSRCRRRPRCESPSMPSAIRRRFRVCDLVRILAPGKTPSAALQTLHAAIAEVSETPSSGPRSQGIEPRRVGLRDFDAHIRNEMDRLAPLLKSIGDQIGN